MWAELGVAPLTAVAVVISTVAIYVVFLVLRRLAGQRTLAAMSNYDVACAIALGAVDRGRAEAAAAAGRDQPAGAGRLCRARTERPDQRAAAGR
jgi:hypothetical protein